MADPKREPTRERARRAAIELVKRAEKPSIDRIRQALGGGGGQAAILAGLNDFWEDLAALYTAPPVPPALWEATQAVWQRATAAADARLAAREAEHQGAVAELKHQLAAAQADAARAAQGRADLEQRLSATGHLLEETQAAVRNREAEVGSLTEAVAQREATIADLRAQLTEAAATAKQQADLHVAALDQLRTALGEKDRANARLETALATAHAAQAALQRTLDEAEARLTAELAARDTRLDQLAQAQAETQAALAAARERLAATAGRLQELGTERDGLAARADHHQGVADTLRSERDRLAVALAEQSARLQAAQAAHAALSDRLDATAAARDTQLRATLTELTDWLARAQKPDRPDTEPA